MSKIIVAIDGYSSCGKSSTAKLVAKQLNYPYIDTGAMYRAVTLYFIQNHISLTNPKEVETALKQINITFRVHAVTAKNETYLNGINVEEEIRKMYVSQKVSDVSALAIVRHELVAIQKRMGKTKGIVMDGRDIGTVVFPQAELKIFMTADPLVRAQRRQQELISNGELVNLDEIIQNLQDRDRIDTTRAESPLKQAEDAVYLDNTHLTLEEQVDVVVQLADQKISRMFRKNNESNLG